MLSLVLKLVIIIEFYRVLMPFLRLLHNSAIVTYTQNKKVSQSWSQVVKLVLRTSRSYIGSIVCHSELGSIEHDRQRMNLCFVPCCNLLRKGDIGQWITLSQSVSLSVHPSGLNNL